MALVRGNRSDIPADAVVLSEEEALKYQIRLLKNWNTSSEVFFFKYGAHILGGASFMTSIFINNHFRNKLRLLHYGRLSSYLPTCVFPTMVTVLSHVELVLADITLQKTPCAVCVESRASALQALFGSVFPYFLGVSSSMGLAHRYVTYDIPYITKEPRKVFELVIKMTRPIKNVLFGIFLGQAALASFITHLEAKSVHTVNSKLLQLEKENESLNHF